jgi:hypothetical protein
MFNITSGCGVGFIHNYVVECSISQVDVGLVSFTIMSLNVQYHKWMWGWFHSQLRCQMFYITSECGVGFIYNYVVECFMLGFSQGLSCCPPWNNVIK